MLVLFSLSVGERGWAGAQKRFVEDIKLGQIEEVRQALDQGMQGDEETVKFLLNISRVDANAVGQEDSSSDSRDLESATEPRTLKGINVNARGRGQMERCISKVVNSTPKLNGYSGPLAFNNFPFEVAPEGPERKAESCGCIDLKTTVAGLRYGREGAHLNCRAYYLARTVSYEPSLRQRRNFSFILR